MVYQQVRGAPKPPFKGKVSALAGANYYRVICPSAANRTSFEIILHRGVCSSEPVKKT